MNRHHFNDTYLRPQTLHDVLKILHDLKNSGQKYFVLAGGTDVLVANRYSPFQEVDQLGSSTIVDISLIPELKGIRFFNGILTIGSLVTHAQLASSELIKEYAPILAAAASEIGSPQIRNRGTIGGNICNASPAADLVPVLTVLDAKVNTAVAQNDSFVRRKISITELITGPFQTGLSIEELLISIEIPIIKPVLGFYHMSDSSFPQRITSYDKDFFDSSKSFWGVGYAKIGRRNAMSISIMGLALLLNFMPLPQKEGFELSESRLCVGAVTPRPVRFTSAEKLLKGLVFDQNAQIKDKSLLHQIALRVIDQMKEVSGIRKSTEFKSSVLENLIPSLIIRTAESAIESFINMSE